MVLKETKKIKTCHCWHIDGYDKIKPFCFAIHGGIDGYSRRVMWLVVDRTNNDPSVTANFFVHCVEKMGVVLRY